MLDIRDEEITSVERLLLPVGCTFQDDARAVIRCWRSTDVAACPGSGKTTVVLAKLKLIADRMPLPNNAGICVLSHTNVAVDTIKARMAEYVGKLMGYPNFVGTIQSFIDQYVTMPYLKRKFGKSVQAVDARTYAEHLCRIVYSGKYRELAGRIRSDYRNSSGQYADETDHVAGLYLRSDGALCMQRRGSPLAGVDRLSAIQFKAALQDMLMRENMIKYTDAYQYAKEALDELTEEYTELFSHRFQYVFVDEYQDCREDQRETLAKLFDPERCCVFHIGDSDQAIYGSDKDAIDDWKPSEQCLSLAVSNRYGQEIADVLTLLRTERNEIYSSGGATGIKPVLFVYDMNTIGDVKNQYILQLERHGLNDANGIYKAIGHIRKDDAKGIKIGSYWDEFDGSRKPQNLYRYWGAIDEICDALKAGNMYIAEPLIRKLLRRIFHYVGIHNAGTGEEHTTTTLRQTLNEKHFDVYREKLVEISEMLEFTREAVDNVFKSLIDQLFEGTELNCQVIVSKLPSYFMEQPLANQIPKEEENVYVDPIRGRRIQFDTVHGVKGETHDATLYLETEMNRSSDIVRALPWLGIGKPGSSTLYDYSRKLVYVGMSRPRKLLCLAIQETTYAKSKKAFQGWEIIDLRRKVVEGSITDGS